MDEHIPWTKSPLGSGRRVLIRDAMIRNDDEDDEQQRTS